MRVHYPRTPHLPWSPGVASDDVRAGGLSGLAGQKVVVTEKLDGENTTLYADGLHARSLDSAHHPSRAWIKALHGRIARSIPQGWRVCGENLYARHSIGYRDLESWFYAFSVWDGDHCLDWDRTVRFARRLGIPVPPVLWRGTFDEKALRAMRLDAARQEGYVVRTVEGFEREEFPCRVAKWVRRGHVQTDEHWMLGPVVENGLGPAAALWEARSGGEPDAESLLAALEGATVGLDDTEEDTGAEHAEAALADVSARLDLLGRSGDARLAGMLAVLFRLCGARRTPLATRLVRPLSMPLARRVADLVELHTGLQRPFPDDERRAGLVRLAVAADVGALHAVAAAVLAGRRDIGAAEAREQVEWSELFAEEAGLLSADPLEPLRSGLRRELGECESDVADRCWAEARELYARGWASEGAIAQSARWRSMRFPRLIVMVGPAGSGKSTFARGLPDVEEVISLDALREARGSRSDQTANRAVLREGLRSLDRVLAGGGPAAAAVWDATALNRHQRSHIHDVARRRGALTTHAVMLVPEDALARRNSEREHPVPPNVLATQLRRFSPPYAGEAHRTWYVGPEGGVLDAAGTIDGEEA